MSGFKEGDFVTVADIEAWRAMNIEPGMVIEVDGGNSSFVGAFDIWIAFLVTKVVTHTSGGMTLTVQFLGASDASLEGELLVSYVDGGQLHVCADFDCSGDIDETVDTVHVTGYRLWSIDAILEAPYMTAQLKGRAKSLFNQFSASQTKTAPKRAPRPAKAKEKAKSQPKQVARKRKTEKDDTGDGEDKGEPKGLDPGKRELLQNKLESIRRRVRGGLPGKAAEPGEEPELPLDFQAPEVEYSPSFVEETELHAGHDLPSLANAERRKSKKNKASGALGGSGTPALEDTRGGTSKNSKEEQLVLKALQSQKLKSAKDAKKKKRKKDSGGKSAATKMVKLFQAILTGGDPTTSSEKKEKKVKKKKRRMTADGRLESWSESSEECSEEDDEKEESEDKSESELEAPMRKKSNEKPGSVLALLTDHVKETLEQGATTSSYDGTSSLVSGVKVMTYFMLHLKPNFPTAYRELRELHHLAAVIDTIRRGDLGKAGDALAARFIALHQSLLDQNWQTAKHMEIFPYEEATAATSSLVLASRRHSRMVAKVSNPYPMSWGSGGRGKGGKGPWQNNYDRKGEPKGDKGKGKKGQGKGKYRTQANEWAAHAAAWKDKQDKPEDKTS